MSMIEPIQYPTLASRGGRYHTAANGLHYVVKTPTATVRLRAGMVVCHQFRNAALYGRLYEWNGKLVDQHLRPVETLCYIRWLADDPDSNEAMDMEFLARTRRRKLRLLS